MFTDQSGDESDGREKFRIEPARVVSKPSENIYTALLEAQKNFAPTKKTGKSDHFGSYSTLTDVLDAVKEPLNAAGIVFWHELRTLEVGEYIVAVLHHAASTTEHTCSVPLMVGKRDMQGFKSANTYARRISLENACGLSAEDDDGNDADKSNSFGASLKDAWKQGVLDSLPENATPAEKAKGFADAICADFEGKGVKALKNRLNAHKPMMDEMSMRFPTLHEQIVDAYENAVIALEPIKDQL